LQAARDSLNEIMYQSQSFAGSTALGIEGSSRQLINEYDRLIGQLQSTVATISSTVEKYRKIDDELKNYIYNRG
ncbi:MAG: hypothetical protein IIZ23_00800, partial [Ruminococcus sp.]|nr:hypothetical protein [Ruminococcus sp.]